MNAVRSCLKWIVGSAQQTGRAAVLLGPTGGLAIIFAAGILQSTVTDPESLVPNDSMTAPAAVAMVIDPPEAVDETAFRQLPQPARAEPSTRGNSESEPIRVTSAEYIETVAADAEAGAVIELRAEIAPQAGVPYAMPDARAARAFAELDRTIESAIDKGAFPGAVVLVGRDGEVYKASAYGAAALYGPDRQKLASPVASSPDTIFDLASISKLFTAVGVMQLVERGEIDLDAPVQRYLPEFTGENKDRVTVRQLLSHSSGLPAGISQGPLISRGENRAERLEFVLKQKLAAKPGEKVIYSDVGYITLGALIERVSGQTQAEFLQANVFGPLGMADTSYRPDPAVRDRIAATVLMPETAKLRKGLIQGEVHDDNAWALEGIAGHAGLFSTAPDLARFAQMILDDGTSQGVQILKPATVAQMTRLQARTNAQQRGLGFEINQSWYMGRLAGPRTVGHTGYSGTSLVINRDTKTFVILLTNRLHPKDEGTNLRAERSAASNQAAAAFAATR